MLARRERLLLILLAVTAGASVLGVGTALGLLRLHAAQENARQYEEQLRKLSASLPSEDALLPLRDSLAAELEAEKGRFYSPGEMNAYLFGILVKRSLAAHGLAVVRYQLVGQGAQESFEFFVSGNIRALVLFLKEVSESKKYWTISAMTITMREATADCSALFRIRYETVDSQSG